MFRLTGALAIAASGSLLAAPLEIARTPVLNATLPTASTWQVEVQESGTGAWVGSGVLVAGSGAAVSVRMDGWPGEAGYRFQRVAGATATISPTLGTGWHLAGQEPGAGQLAIESSADLAGWAQAALLFPGTDGRYVRAVREPLGARGFFRARVPSAEMAVGDASVTSYERGPGYAGAAGFEAIGDDMPAIFQSGFIGALSPTEYHRGGENAAAAGECYELAGPFGRTTLMISDLTTAPAGTIDVGRSYFDISTTPYPILSGGPDSGALTAGFRLVPAPVTGNVKLFVPTTSGPYYVELRPYNYRAGVKKVELKNGGSSTWQELPRSPFNSFVFSAGGSVLPLSFPVEVRVTSRFGEVVSFPPIASLTSNQKITGSAQFTVFPELAPMPERRLRPAYVDRFTSLPGQMWSYGPYGGSSVTEVDTAVAYEGTASARISGLANYAGVTFSAYPDFPRPEFGVLKLAIRSASPVAADQLGMSVFGANSPGGGAIQYSGVVQLPAVSTSWQVFQIPLQASGAPPVIWGFSIYARIAGALPNVWLDSIGFEER